MAKQRKGQRQKSEANIMQLSLSLCVSVLWMLFIVFVRAFLSLGCAPRSLGNFPISVCVFLLFDCAFASLALLHHKSNASNR
jgi:hypothetical protein